MLVEGGLVGITYLSIQSGAAAALPNFRAGLADSDALDVFREGQTGVFPKNTAEIGWAIVTKACQLCGRKGFHAVIVDIGQDLLKLVRMLREAAAHFSEDHRQQKINSRLRRQLIAYILPFQLCFQQPEHILKAIPFLRRKMNAPTIVIDQ